MKTRNKLKIYMNELSLKNQCLGFLGPKPKDWTVFYLFHYMDICKIGISKRVLKRLTYYDYTLPAHKRLLICQYSSPNFEKRIKKIFKHHTVWGTEWFSFDDENVAEIYNMLSKSIPSKWKNWHKTSAVN